MGRVLTPTAPQIMKRDAWVPEALSDYRDWDPRTGLGRIIKDCLRYLPAEMAAELVGRVSRVVVVESRLSLLVWRACGEHGVWWCGCPVATEDYGVVSERLVTDDGVDFLVDAWQNSVELENLKYHGIGTGATAEAAGDSALVAELTTQYNPDSTRATGTTEEGASTNIFKTVATNTVDAGVTIEEHGVFSQAATGGGTLWDRSLTGTKTLASGEGLQSTYELTATAGG